MTIFLTMTGLLVSQNLFAKTYGGTGLDEAHCVIETSDLGFALSGYTTSYGSKSLLVVKLSSTGDVAWAKVIETLPPDFDYGWSSIIQTSEGGYVIVSNTRGYGAGMVDDIIIVKMTSTGDIEWAKTYGESGLDYGQRIIQTGDGGYAVYGGTWNYGSSGWAYFLMKISSAGTLEWSRFYDASEHDNGNGFSLTQDSGYVMSGYTRCYGVNWDGFVLKVNSSGYLEWSRAYGGNGTDGDCYTIQTSDLGLLTVGNTSSFGAGADDAMIIKTNASGIPLWARAVGGNLDERPRDVVALNDGGALITMYTQSFGAGNDDIMILRIDAVGNLLWAKTFGGTGVDQPWRAIRTSDNGFAIAGVTYSYGAGDGDFLLIKMDSSGDYPGCLINQNPQSVNISVNVTEATSGATCSPVVNQVDPTVTTGTLSVANHCIPLQVGDIGHEAPENKVMCLSAPGALVFVSGEETAIGIYSPDGRLAYTGHLQKGENRITLDQGVYLWQAGQYKGKAVVR